MLAQQTWISSRPFYQSLQTFYKHAERNGDQMRTLVQPPPSIHCDRCGGDLRLKLVKPSLRTDGFENETLVCETCSREQSCIVEHDKYSGPTSTDKAQS